MSILSENVESLLATLARLHAIDGQAREVAVLTEAQPTITVGEWVGSSHEIAALVLCLTIPIRLFSQLRADKEAIEKSILKNAAEVFSASEDEFIEQVIIIPAVSPGEDGWREKARAWTRGENISNQGRVRSDNVAPKECDGLLFRSEAEIELYKALKSLGVSFAPLPVFIRGGKEYRRIEPDFVILKDGILLVVEVDGDTVHRETPAEAHARTTMLAHEGAYVERVRAVECSTTEAARSCAQRLLDTIAKQKQNR